VKRFIIIIILSLAITIIFSASQQGSQNLNTGKFLSRILYQSLEYFHFTNKKLDDDFSIKGFDEYLKFLDYNKQFLLKEDIQALEEYKDKIDDHWINGETLLMNLASNKMHMRINQVKAFYAEILAKPFDFSKDETIEIDRKKKDYCLTIEELKDRWRKILKNQTLIRYINLLQSNKGKKKKYELQKKAQTEVLKSFKFTFNRIQQTNKNDALSVYLNSFLRVWDPHTAYMAPTDRETFNLEMSGSFQGIGALLREEEGYVKVVRIIHGGPAWKQKKLQANDLILKVAQAKKEPVDVIGMRTTDAVKLIRGAKGTLVKLTVKKPDGRIEVIPIVRDVVIVEETFAKSAVIQDARFNRKFGYITLPRFYKDFSKKDGRNSTTDVKKELERLLAQNVEGIILDLRNNGGGALDDAIRISGLFIPQGPIVQTKTRRLGIKVFDDPDHSISYVGPLVILINNYSASAAEIVAAALQDYNRAIIVGSAHSYGKGTVQILINLAQYLPRNQKQNMTIGALKITIQKFYRITGSSNQYKGVIPDVIIPDPFQYLEIGEKYTPHSLKWDTVPSLSFKKWSGKQLNIEQLALNSRERIKQSAYFKSLQQYAKYLKLTRTSTSKSLQLKKVMKTQEASKKKVDQLNKLNIQLPTLQVFLPSLADDKEKGRYSKKVKTWQKNLIDQIKKDYYLNEALAVLNDLSRG